MVYNQINEHAIPLSKIIISSSYTELMRTNQHVVRREKRKPLRLVSDKFVSARFRLKMFPLFAPSYEVCVNILFNLVFVI